jgi:hypothetical protein
VSIFSWLWLLTAIGLPPACSFGWHLLMRSSRHAFLGGWLSCAIWGVIIGILYRDWIWAIGNALSVVAAIVARWLNRRRRDRAKAWLGAKSRALRDALVRRQREMLRPRPVLSPLPGGAR